MKTYYWLMSGTRSTRHPAAKSDRLRVLSPFLEIVSATAGTRHKAVAQLDTKGDESTGFLTNVKLFMLKEETAGIVWCCMSCYADIGHSFVVGRPPTCSKCGTTEEGPSYSVSFGEP